MKSAKIALFFLKNLLFVGLVLFVWGEFSVWATPVEKKVSFSSQAQGEKASLGSLGAPCKIDGSCNLGGVCYELGDGGNICLMPKEDDSLVAVGCGCHSSSFSSSWPFSFFLLFLWWVLFLFRRIRSFHR